MVDCARLEIECGSDVTVGSNPTLSAFREILVSHYPPHWGDVLECWDRINCFLLIYVKPSSASLKEGVSDPFILMSFSAHLFPVVGV